MTLRNPKKNPRKESWQRFKWYNQMAQVGQVGTSGSSGKVQVDRPIVLVPLVPRNLKTPLFLFHLFHVDLETRFNLFHLFHLCQLVPTCAIWLHHLNLCQLFFLRFFLGFLNVIPSLEKSFDWKFSSKYRRLYNYWRGEINNSRLHLHSNKSLVSTRHRKQIRNSPSYCSVNLTGLGGRGG